MLVITVLLWLGWRNLHRVVPGRCCLMTVGIVFACCVPADRLLARTPLAVPLTGRRASALVPAAQERPGARAYSAGSGAGHAVYAQPGALGIVVERSQQT